MRDARLSLDFPTIDGLWHPFRMQGHLWFADRWCHCARPPANLCHLCRDGASGDELGKMLPCLSPFALRKSVLLRSKRRHWERTRTS
jgi:hypothetical protein